ncbi:hypothetical protein SAY86_009024 [Trapa natans]|uniref:ALBINO3-like protein 2, chloroplastic n=1 Tax=Trapa natans TaxID=22666 RepID=A0AAN7KAJ6_TRANT|nr:hypothetical protein SAY86_009024 [Trapa natans]
MVRAYSKLSSHLRSWRVLSNSPFLCHLPSSNCHRFIASLYCPPPLSRPQFQFHHQFSDSSSRDDPKLWGFGESMGAGFEVDDLITSGLNEAADRVTKGGSVLPIESLTALLDYYHGITSLPWWAVIASSTLAMRITLLPILILQLKKLKTIGEFMPKLPKPFPPLFSGRSYFDHISLFLKERRASGCPSLLWMFASPAIQAPCFILWMATIRRMSLDNHPGFDCGGMLWFQNLTENPQGVIGLILPLLIGGLHYTNIQVAFSRFQTRKYPNVIDSLAKGYKNLLAFMALPIVCGSCYLPQGCLIYWITNLSSSILLQTVIHHPDVRTKLGLRLPAEVFPKEATNTNKIVELESTSLDPNPRRTSIQDLTPRELLALSVQVIAQGNKNEGISLLELALEKDPGYVRAMIVLGQALLQTEEPEEAAEYLERAISKLFDAGNPMEKEDENLDLLIVSSQWAGVSYIRQSKYAEGLVHLERIATFKEPNEPKIKAHYYDGLVLLSSALFNQGRTDEAAKYLRLSAAYDSKYNELLEQCEKECQGLCADTKIGDSSPLKNEIRGDD